MARSDRWEHRLMDSYRMGLNRQARRDLARASRQPSSPRGRGPVPKAILLVAMQIRERDLKYGTGLGAGQLQVSPEGSVDGEAVQERSDSLSPTDDRKSNLRLVSDKRRLPGLR